MRFDGVRAGDSQPTSELNRTMTLAEKHNRLFRLRTAVSRTKPEVIFFLHKAIVRPNLEFCIQAWTQSLKMDRDRLETVQ